MIELKRIGDIPIYVLENGRFQASIGKETLTRKDLRDVERWVFAHTTQGVKVLCHSAYHPSEEIRTQEVVRQVGDAWQFANGSKSRGRYQDNFVIWTEEVESKLGELAGRLKALHEQEAAIANEWRQCIDEGARLTEQSFEEAKARQSESGGEEPSQ